MVWRLMLHLDRDGNEPPACAIGNSSAHDLAMETQFLGHVDLAQLWDVECMSIDRELIVRQIEAQSIPFLALEMWEACFLSILAWMFELGLRSFSFHPPVVGEGLPKIGKGLFWSTFRRLIDPRKSFALDAVVLRLEGFHRDPFPLCTCSFPASQRPVIGMSRHAASLTKVDFLIWCWIESDHVRTIHGLPFILTDAKRRHDTTSQLA